MKVAILKHHEFSAWRAIEVPAGQSLDFDEKTATRRWLHPALGTDWHLLEFVETEPVTPVHPECEYCHERHGSQIACPAYMATKARS